MSGRGLRGSERTGRLRNLNYRQGCTSSRRIVNEKLSVVSDNNLSCKVIIVSVQLYVCQAKVAFLQGERKGHENLMRDLIRRIKMLEYALKQER